MFKMDEHKDPSIQIAKLNNITGCLAMNRFPISDEMQAVVVLAAMPASWDGMVSSILHNTELSDMNLPHLILILKNEYSCQSARSGNKTAHFAKTNM